MWFQDNSHRENYHLEQSPRRTTAT